MKDIERAIRLYKEMAKDKNDEIAQIVLQALEKQLNSDWIPVSERLPEKGGYYLVSTQYETPRVMIGFYYTDLNTWNYWMSNCLINSVIAWQPLPEPYKGEE